MTAPPEPILSEAEIRDRVRQLGDRISEDYKDVDELFMVGVLRGAFIFLADLSRSLAIPRRVDFIALSSYENGHHRAAVRLIMDLRSDIRMRHVLVVEDIVDTGHTLAYLMDNFGARQPASIRSCVLVRKPRHEVPVQIDYLGFEIPDIWVVGYGLDYNDQYRTLPYIGVLPPQG